MCSLQPEPVIHRIWMDVHAKPLRHFSARHRCEYGVWKPLLALRHGKECEVAAIMCTSQRVKLAAIVSEALGCHSQ